MRRHYYIIRPDEDIAVKVKNNQPMALGCKLMHLQEVMRLSFTVACFSILYKVIVDVKIFSALGDMIKKRSTRKAGVPSFDGQ